MKNLTQLIEKARNLPAMAPIHALEIDRQLRAMGKAPITFSAHGLAEGSIATVRVLKLEHLFTALARPEGGNAIYQAEMLVKEGKRSEAIAHAFAHAQGPQVNSLNLFYANHATQRPEIRRYYLNKYLSAYGLCIELEQGENTDFFYRIKSGNPFEKVDGPLVTVIMPAHNAEATIELAVNSLLNQSWHNLQIIIVDDASTDSTLQKAKAIAKRDPRVEVLSNPVNVGAYASRNLGVLHTRGEWLTVHDADDWAFPDRIEQQVKVITDTKAHTCTGSMLRMNAQGQITRPSPSVANNEDGYQRLCFVSLMVQAEVFRKELGAWDSVRVSGDAEMVARLKVLGVKGTHLGRPVMLCLDHAAGLTNHAKLGLVDENGRMRQVRSDYQQAYEKWHRTEGTKKLSPHAGGRIFNAPEANQVNPSEIKKVCIQGQRAIKPTELVDFAAQVARDHQPPKRSRELLTAHEIARNGNDAAALLYAQKYVPPEFGYTIETLRANAALRRQDQVGWLKHLNAYLAHFCAAPVHLGKGATLPDRFRTAHLPAVIGGPLVSVIMPAWNTQKTVRAAALSILNQTWRNLELLIVDDFSEDSTWEQLQILAAEDDRVNIFRNKINVGPYVSKNIMLSMAKGEWITGHDADDWAHPQRIEHHMQALLQFSSPPRASVSFMLRLEADGMLDRFAPISDFSLDGAARDAAISCTFEKHFLKDTLGGWDNVRFGADSELISRTQTLIGEEFKRLPLLSMLCMNYEGSLTNNPKFGVTRTQGPSEIRVQYSNAWRDWHKTLPTEQAGKQCLPFPPICEERKFAASKEALVPLHNIRRNFAAHTGLDLVCNEAVTAICPSKRPWFAERVAEMMVAQTHKNLHMIYVAHGPGHDIAQLRRLFASRSVTILELADPDEPLGAALNLALDHCKTDICAKIDDDDFYGPNYIRTSLAALRYCGHENVGIVGRERAYVYVEEMDLMALRYSSNHENSLRNRVFGGTIFWSRAAVSDQRFLHANTGEDSDFFRQSIEKGVKIFSAESSDYVLLRYHSPGAHTWNINAADFLRLARPLAKGIRLDLAYSSPYSTTKHALIPHRGQTNEN